MPVQFWDPTSSFGALSGPCIYRRYYLLLSSTPTQITMVVAYFVTIALYPLAVIALRNL
jgi:hypothetical protein